LLRNGSLTASVLRCGICCTKNVQQMQNLSELLYEGKEVSLRKVSIKSWQEFVLVQNQKPLLISPTPRFKSDSRAGTNFGSLIEFSRRDCSFGSPDQFAELQAQGTCERVGHFDSDAYFAQLNRTDVGPVYVGALRKILLRKP
jgi:hypothetical protein